jgi:hypothetical protein
LAPVAKICFGLFGDQQIWCLGATQLAFRCRLCGADVEDENTLSHEKMHVATLPAKLKAVLQLDGELDGWKAALQIMYPDSIKDYYESFREDKFHEKAKA